MIFAQDFDHLNRSDAASSNKKNFMGLLDSSCHLAPPKIINYNSYLEHNNCVAPLNNNEHNRCAVALKNSEYNNYDNNIDLIGQISS